MEIEIYNLICFVFYKVYIGLLTRVIGNLGWLSFFLYFFLNWFFLIFICQHWVDWEFNFIIYFNLLYMGLSQFYNLDREFDRLIRVDSGCFLIFLIDLFSILYFSIELIENWVT